VSRDGEKQLEGDGVSRTRVCLVSDLIANWSLPSFLSFLACIFAAPPASGFRAHFQRGETSLPRTWIETADSRRGCTAPASLVMPPASGAPHSQILGRLPPLTPAPNPGLNTEIRPDRNHIRLGSRWLNGELDTIVRYVLAFRPPVTLTHFAFFSSLLLFSPPPLAPDPAWAHSAIRLLLRFRLRAFIALL
jgi:hypothetical protein